MSKSIAKFTANLQFDGEFYRMGYIHVPLEISESIPNYQKRPRLRCQLDNMEPFSCALLGYTEGHRILINNKSIKTNGWILGQPISVTLHEDTSKYGMEMPEVWEVFLDQDEEAASAFEKLTPGKKRSVLYMVGQPKREETQIKRALLIARNLKAGAWDPRDFMKKGFIQD